jgi:hypothetical protein
VSLSQADDFKEQKASSPEPLEHPLNLPCRRGLIEIRVGHGWSSVVTKRMRDVE